MTFPKWIKLNNKQINYSECNVYQRAIYAELAKQITDRQKLSDQTEIVKRDGVIEYLVKKFDLYGTLTATENLYQK